MKNHEPDYTHISALNDQFEAALRSGTSPQIEDFLEEITPHSRDDLFRQLLSVEVEYRIETGEQPAISDYVKRFPMFRSFIEEIFTENAWSTISPSRDEQSGFAETVYPDKRSHRPADNLPRHRVIDRYKLLQKLGAGGMGEVWMAEQSEPVKRRVALKLIKSGVSSDQIIARFVAERQTLAMMEHQNIARVLDAGQTDDGMPYCGSPRLADLRIVILHC